MIKLPPKIVLNRGNINKVPQAFGIYVFLDSNAKPLYVGKSVNLKSRLLSYLNLNLSIKTKKMISESKYFTYVLVNSETEALLLEANLIKKLNTFFNIQLKDDKAYLYVRITENDYPQVLTCRKKDIFAGNIAYFGPFPSSRNVKTVLNIIRRIVPYSTHKVSARACIYHQMGLCDPCPSLIEQETEFVKKRSLKIKYRHNIKLIKSILSGQIQEVISSMEKNMRGLAESEHFEDAAIIREQIAKLKYITKPTTNSGSFLQNPNLFDDIRENAMLSLETVLEPYFHFEKKIQKVECYDVAHLGGTNTTSSMVTFVNGAPDKSLYRHFKIKHTKGNDDFASLAEVAKRRANHFNDWGKPDLIVIDGGKGQVGVFNSVMAQYGIRVIGIAKRFERLIIPVAGKDMKYLQLSMDRANPALLLIEHLRDEAHRFARRYHHLLIKKSLLNEN